MMQLFYDGIKNIRSQPRWFSSAIIINQSVFKLRCKQTMNVQNDQTELIFFNIYFLFLKQENYGDEYN